MDRNNPKDLYDWFMKIRMVEPRDCQELLDCVKAILAYMENEDKKDYNRSGGYKSNAEFLRKKLLLGEDLAWSIEDLERIRGIVHWEMKSIERRRRKQAKKCKRKA